jgi:hypothetical protein
MGNLQMAGDQLSEMEMLGQELDQIESMLSELQDTKNDLDNPCPNCGGAGCDKCKRRGGMGRKAGRGRGGVAPEEETAVAFKRHKAKVKTTKGSIVGQFLVDGQQAKGEVSDEVAEAIAAAEREATDLVHRDRIPRQYQKSIKEYFSTMQRPLDRAIPVEGDTAEEDRPAGEAPADEAGEESEGTEDSD